MGLSASAACALPSCLPPPLSCLCCPPALPPAGGQAAVGLHQGEWAAGSQGQARHHLWWVAQLKCASTPPLLSCMLVRMDRPAIYLALMPRHASSMRPLRRRREAAEAVPRHPLQHVQAAEAAVQALQNQRCAGLPLAFRGAWHVLGPLHAAALCWGSSACRARLKGQAARGWPASTA